MRASDWDHRYATAEYVWRRAVQTPEGDREAIDCLVRAHRATEETP